ncbi:dihydrofolate reductase [Cytophagaceae bacterium ABcell3]|nr:dihydrofolate reductase [Cytophagaceae bacterium ABcell3]
MLISTIVAVSENNVIGKDNQLIWHLPKDLKHFRNTTLGHHVIMGRKTFESMGKPLPGRFNIVVTRNSNFKPEGCIVTDSPEKALDIARKAGETEAFIIGGSSLFNTYLDTADKLYLTEVKASFDGDVKIKDIDKSKYKVTCHESHQPDEKHKYPFDILTLEKE